MGTNGEVGASALTQNESSEHRGLLSGNVITNSITQQESSDYRGLLTNENGTRIKPVNFNVKKPSYANKTDQVLIPTKEQGMECEYIEDLSLQDYFGALHNIVKAENMVAGYKSVNKVKIF